MCGLQTVSRGRIKDQRNGNRTKTQYAEGWSVATAQEEKKINGRKKGRTLELAADKGKPALGKTRSD
jgi:hypothetical protein